MGLKGKISEFGIADIFQLLFVQQKSGALEIITSKGEMVFIFKEGQLVDVTPDVRIKDQLIGQMLVDGGFISDTERNRYLKVHLRKGKKFGEILLEKEIVDDDTLSRFLTIQIKECFFQALTYKGGDYRFDAFTVSSYPPIKLPVRVDQLLLEGMQFLDEFPLVMKKFPAKGVLIKAAEGFEQENFKEDRIAFDVYSLMNEYMEPIKHIRRAGLTELEGYKAFAYLNEKGALLIKEEVQDVLRKEKEEAKRRDLRLMQLSNAVNLCFFTAFVGAVIYFFCDIIFNSGIFLFVREIFKGF
jgi:hypothetical protein